MISNELILAGKLQLKKLQKKKPEKNSGFDGDLFHILFVVQVTFFIFERGKFKLPLAVTQVANLCTCVLFSQEKIH